MSRERSAARSRELAPGGQGNQRVSQREAVAPPRRRLQHAAAAGELGSASISASVVPTHMCVVYSAKQASACVRRLSAKARAQKFTFTATAAGTIAGARASTHAIGACRVMRAGWGGGSAGLSAKRRQHRAERWGCGAATKAYCYSGTGLQGAAAWGRPHGRMRQIVSPTAVAGKVTGECS